MWSSSLWLQIYHMGTEKSVRSAWATSVFSGFWFITTWRKLRVHVSSPVKSSLLQTICSSWSWLIFLTLETHVASCGWLVYHHHRYTHWWPILVTISGYSQSVSILTPLLHCLKCAGMEYPCRMRIYFCKLVFGLHSPREYHWKVCIL